MVRGPMQSHRLKTGPIYSLIALEQGWPSFWPEGRIHDCLATRWTNRVPFIWQAAANAVHSRKRGALKMCKIFGGPD